MAVPIARHLVEFPPLDRAREHAYVSGHASAFASARGTDAPSLAEQLAQSHERGREEGLAAARAGFEDLLAEERSRFDERLAAERAEWIAEQSDRLTADIRAGLQDLEGRIAGAVGRILTPFTEQALRESIVSDLSETLERLLANECDAVLRISGPDDLLQALRQRLSRYSAAVEYLASDSAELRVVAGETVLETQLQAWAERLREACG